MDDPLVINRRLSVPPNAIEFTAIRASGPGGQSVNKTNSAVQLRCDLNSFYIPEGLRQRIIDFSDARITNDGVIVIKAQNHRSQARNKDDALRRLKTLLRKAIHVEPPRKMTRPSYSSVRRNKRAGARRSEIKSLRGRVKDWD